MDDQHPATPLGSPPATVPPGTVRQVNPVMAPGTTEALPAHWRGRAEAAQHGASRRSVDYARGAVFLRCADDLEAALAATGIEAMATPVEALAVHWDKVAARLHGESPFREWERGHAERLAQCAQEARERLAPAWDELTAERDAARGTRDVFAGRLGYVQDALAEAGYGPGPSDGAIRALARERDGLRQEMQDVHDAIQAAYPGREITEDTVSVLAGLVAERDDARKELDAARARAAAVREQLEGAAIGMADGPAQAIRGIAACIVVEPPDGSGQAALTAEELAPRLWDAYAAAFLSALPAGRVEALRAKWSELTGTERASWLAAAREALGSGQQATLTAEELALLLRHAHAEADEIPDMPDIERWTAVAETAIDALATSRVLPAPASLAASGHEDGTGGAEVRLAACPAHDGQEHAQVRTREHWLCVKGLLPLDEPLAWALGEFARIWGDLIPELPDSYGCTLTCTEANAAAGLFRALGDDATANSVIAAHIARDDEDEATTHDDSARAGLEGTHG